MSALRAAWKLEAAEGKRRLEQLASWLEPEHPAAAASLREGLPELFTINDLGLPPQLRRCLGSTNLIDASHAGLRQKTRHVTRWRSGEMALRWSAAALTETAKNYRRIMGYDQLWMLKAHLDENAEAAAPVAASRQAG